MSLISRQPTKGSREGRAGGTTREVCTGGGLAGTIGIAGDLLWDGLPGTSPRKFPREKIQDFSKIGGVAGEPRFPALELLDYLIIKQHTFTLIGSTDLM
jgi:hypothetical protein